MRGRLGSAPFMPGGEAWRDGGNPATAAAAAEAATGAWLAELEASLEGRGAAPPPKALGPGLTHGIFGAWAASEGSSAAAAATGAEMAALALGEAEVEAETAVTGQQQQQQRVDLQQLFSGIWMVEGEEEDEQQEGQEDEVEGSAQQAEVAGGLAAVLDQLALPGEAELPGGVVSASQDGELAGALAPGGRRPSAAAGGAAAGAAAPAIGRRGAGSDAEWAIK